MAACRSQGLLVILCPGLCFELSTISWRGECFKQSSQKKHTKQYSSEHSSIRGLADTVDSDTMVRDAYMEKIERVGVDQGKGKINAVRAHYQTMHDGGTGHNTCGLHSRLTV